VLVASVEGEISELEVLRARGVANGATSLQMVDAPFVRRREPQVHAVAAVWSPDTGILETEALISTLSRLCRERDVAMLVGTAVVGASPSIHGIELVTSRERFVARTVVNAVGLTQTRFCNWAGGAFTSCRAAESMRSCRRRGDRG
jgi:L-2-hydroxyglutarate oxidase LhgO